eukprot:Lithocolla_globosa_v1_NODE_2836_length_1853_cov_17.979422.p1 type:complete len:332 gc:universal NODE_2836_length_1853_cov_17.979422:1702-707(-)
MYEGGGFSELPQRIGEFFRTLGSTTVFDSTPRKDSLNWFAPDEARFIGTYTNQQIKMLMHTSGILKDMQSQIPKGGEVVVTTNTKDPFCHSLYVNHHLKEETHLLFELNIRRISHLGEFETNFGSEMQKKGSNFFFGFLSQAQQEKQLDISYIQFIRLQNPHLTFDDSKPKLPGQLFPGLHVLNKVFKLILSLASDHSRDGVSNVPQYFHNAVMYSKHEFIFGNPLLEGVFRALVRDLKSEIEKNSLASVSTAFMHGRVRMNDKLILWAASDQIHPCSKRFKAYLENKEYKQLMGLCEKSIKPGSFTVNWEADLPSNEELQQGILFRNIDV